MSGGVTATLGQAPAILTERDSLAQFLNTLWPDLDGRWCLFWGAPSKKSIWVQSFTPDTLTMLERWAETEDVYIGCGLRGNNLGPTLRGEKADVVAIPGLWLDVDYDTDPTDHKKPNLPPTEQDAMTLIAEMGPKPTMIVHSGHGLQAWWLFREPWIFESDEDRAKAERLTKGWCATVRAKAKAHGWDADQVGDLTRVMRLPGLWNRKGVPTPTQLFGCPEEAQYNPEDFETYLTVALSDQTTLEQHNWQFVLNPQAEPPSDKFLLLSEIDTLFTLSWRHARTDLQDQSASSYDLSLATRALRAGWTGQETVNLLIAHRRHHRKDLKLRKDYYERTLNAATSGKSGEIRTEVVDATPLNGHTAAVSTITKPFPLTDAGNAEHFAGRYGGAVRYDHRRGRWLLWRPPLWRPDVDAEIRRLAKKSIRDRVKADSACDTDEWKRIAKWAMNCESRSRLDALISLAQAETPIADAGDNWDSDPFLLCALNGVVDLRTGTLRAGRQEDRLTMSAAVPFDPEATCPRWERFIEEIFGADRDLMSFVQRAIGYSLTGDTIEQCLFLCYGTGANGKSTLVNTVERLLADYALNMPFSTIELHQRASIPNDLAALVCRRFIIASETNDGTILNESRVKALTGCDSVTARFLHAEFFTFEPVAKLWLNVNHKPLVRDDSHGFWRRIRLIPFLQKFPINKGLEKELLAEGPGILAWAVRGCLEWQRLGGLQPPKIVREATEGYARDSDSLHEFLEERCQQDPSAQIGAADFYVLYTQWANHRGFSERERLNNTQFGRKIGDRFSSVHTRKGKVYRGVGKGTV